MHDQALRNRIVTKLLRDRVVGEHKWSVDKTVSRSLPTHERGRGKTVIEEMVADPNVPVEAYGGGHRENIRLTSVEAAVDYLEANNGDVPFGFG